MSGISGSNERRAAAALCVYDSLAQQVKPDLESDTESQHSTTSASSTSNSDDDSDAATPLRVSGFELNSWEEKLTAMFMAKLRRVEKKMAEKDKELARRVQRLEDAKAVERMVRDRAVEHSGRTITNMGGFSGAISADARRIADDYVWRCALADVKAELGRRRAAAVALREALSAEEMQHPDGRLARQKARSLQRLRKEAGRQLREHDMQLRRFWAIVTEGG
ncbi:hypothetical protein JCM10213_003539 [Rhodosporidiobolus nylandii]